MCFYKLTNLDLSTYGYLDNLQLFVLLVLTTIFNTHSLLITNHLGSLDYRTLILFNILI
jgi:hypothetical protein